MKKEDIAHLAQLARIEVPEGEAEGLAKDISGILEYISEINSITAGAVAEKKVGALYNVMRKDESPHEAGIHTEDLLNVAPERDGDYITVKRILGDAQ